MSRIRTGWVNARVSSSERERLDRLAAAKGVSRGKVIRELVDRAVQELDGQGKQLDGQSAAA